MLRSPGCVAQRLVRRLRERLGEVPRPWNGSPQLACDPLFVFRGHPDFPEHDALGYRNPEVPAGMSILCLGDSQVYGSTLTAEQAWPRELERRTGSSVYNGAIAGGFPFQTVLAAEELKALSPEHVFAAIYTGDDLLENWSYLPRSESPLADEFWDPAYDGLPRPDIRTTRQERERFVCSLAEELPGETPREQLLAHASAEGVVDCNYAEVGKARYFLEDTLRLRVQDLFEPAVRAGLEIAKRCALHLQRLAFEQGFGLTIVLIPTREYLVYRSVDEARVQRPESLVRLGQNESRVLHELGAFFTDRGIDYHDLSRVLGPFIGEPIYPQLSVNGHPTALGCRLIAGALSERLAEREKASVSDTLYPLY